MAANVERHAAVIFNQGTVTVFLGRDAGVLASDGFPLVAGASLTDDATTDAWWAITASGTGDLRILEVG